MIIVDSAIWIDHLHHGDDHLIDLMADRRALMHPFVIGEVALGSLRDRQTFIAIASKLPRPPVADAAEILNLINSAALGGSGIGYVDTHLIASTILVPKGVLWTNDRRLHAVAERLGIAA